MTKSAQEVASELHGEFKKRGQLWDGTEGNTMSKRAKGPTSFNEVRNVLETLAPVADALPATITTAGIVHGALTLAAAHARLAGLDDEQRFADEAAKAFRSVNLDFKGTG